MWQTRNESRLATGSAMGGDAFDGTQRLDRASLARVFARLSAILDAVDLTDLAAELGVAYVPRLRYAMPPELLDKQSFGDLDLHYTLETGPDDTSIELASEVSAEIAAAAAAAAEAEAALTRRARALVADAVFSGLECVERLGDEHLLTAERFQVDLDFFERRLFALSLAVKANGDMSWMLNLSLRRAGIKLNELGVFLRKESSDPELLRDLELTRDPSRVALFLGLPTTAFDGTKSLSMEEVFEHVCSTRFFRRSHVDCYTATDNADTRRRNAKRPMLAAFAAWVAARESGEGGGVGGGGEGGEAPPLVPLVPAEEQREAAAFFGRGAALAAAREEARAAWAELEHKKECKDAFNGKVVMQRQPRLSGPQVGQLMARVLERHGGSWAGLRAWIDVASPGQLGEEVDDVARALLAETDSEAEAATRTSAHERLEPTLPKAS